MIQIPTAFIALIAVVAATVTYADDLTTAKPVEQLRYGKQSDDTMAIVIGGDVAACGKYFVPKGFGLKSILGIVGGYGWKGHRTHDAAKTAQFRGKVRISRPVEGAKPTLLEFEISSLQKASTTDFELSEGDVIEFVAMRFYEK